MDSLFVLGRGERGEGVEDVCVHDHILAVNHHIVGVNHQISDFNHHIF